MLLQLIANPTAEIQRQQRTGVAGGIGIYLAAVLSAHTAFWVLLGPITPVIFVAMLLVEMAIGAIGLLVLAALSRAVAGALGGYGTTKDAFTALSLALAPVVFLCPLTLIARALGWAGVIMLLPLLLILWLWTVYLMVSGLSTTLHVSRSAAAASISLPLLAWSCLCCFGTILWILWLVALFSRG